MREKNKDGVHDLSITKKRRILENYIGIYYNSSFFWRRYWRLVLIPCVELKQLSRALHKLRSLSSELSFSFTQNGTQNCASNTQRLKHHLVSTIWYPTFKKRSPSSANLVVPPQPSSAVIRCDTSKAPPEPWDTMACDIRLWCWLKWPFSLSNNTGNQQLEPKTVGFWKKNFLFNYVIFGFHVNFPGCTWNMWLICFEHVLQWWMLWNSLSD